MRRAREAEAAVAEGRQTSDGGGGGGGGEGGGAAAARVRELEEQVRYAAITSLRAALCRYAAITSLRAAIRIERLGLPPAAALV